MYLENAAINEAETLSLGSECYGSTGELAGGCTETCALLIFINCTSKCVYESRKIMRVYFPICHSLLAFRPCTFFDEEM